MKEESIIASEFDKKFDSDEDVVEFLAMSSITKPASNQRVGIKDLPENVAMNLKTLLGRLRLLAILEGISYLLFGITMPLKYMLDITEPNFYVGMTHGWLFVMYIIVAFQNSYIYRWGLKTSFLVLAASLIPFGTFVVDAKILKPVVYRDQVL